MNKKRRELWGWYVEDMIFCALICLMIVAIGCLAIYAMKQLVPVPNPLADVAEVTR